ncbi:mpv17-like protein [Drosophila sulfurigaster albostrigata]|uniref:mpv17-like protein n=1 Tax=Drosophila sulfurigaster albostrigata TaxID=89887 RepID=UPI002D2184F7|nr:mpv17-like protein [Drosophila sulfurigaster albostrigata]
MSLAILAREGFNAAIIMGISDMIAQLAIEKRSYKDYNLSRTARYSAIGLFVCGPLLRRWYIKLDTLVSKDQPALQRSLKKMVVDQTCFAPPFTLLLSYLVPLVNGERHADIVQRIREQYFTILQRGYMLWPLAQLINFTLIPINYQVLFVQLTLLIWNCYLSIALNEKK